MICANCGSEIEPGLVFCPVCGKTQQLVPDYIEEEDLLSDADRADDTRYEDRREKRRELRRRKKRRRRILMIGAAVLLAVVVIGVFCWHSVRANSYSTQMRLAEQAYENENYEKAISHAQKALTLKGSSVETRLLLYVLYGETGQTDLSLLLEVLELDPDNEDAYLYLIAYYSESDDYASLLELAENVPDETLLTLFEGYLVALPDISPDEGTYEHNTEISISAEENLTVYYTTDGSTPSEASDVYTQAFELESGTWTVSAIAVDENGNRSLIMQAVYVIDPQQPSAVSISPAGGTYTEEISITLTADEGCTIYYGWDTQLLSEMSEYTKSITIPEGNHILCAIAVSEDGIESDLSSKSFIYLPADEDTAE